MTGAPSLAGRRLRAGSAFDLVVYDRLPAEERVALASLAAEPDFFGVLRPREGSALTVKSVSRDTALLWFTLQQPGPLPFFADPSEPETAAALWQLVLDAVLEVEADGRYVAGVQAAHLFGTLASDTEAASRKGVLGERSRLALAHAERSGLADADELAARLYRFGVEPVSPTWWSRLPDAAHVLAFVGAGAGSALSRRLHADWEAAAPDAAAGWLAWQRRSGVSARGGAAEPTHKLYVSPRIDELPAVFDLVLRDLPDGVHAFKIGADAAGLLRPDKMVLYADSPDTLHAVARALEPRLVGVAVQGVPFSAELGARGLLSWGMDPPAHGSRLPWQGAESWRLWVVRRLAVALSAALAALKAQPGAALSAAAFALERLRQDGVDVDHWTPALRLWRGA